MLERQEVSNFTQHNIQPYITEFTLGSALGEGQVWQDKLLEGVPKVLICYP
jgi:hypothetical protein